jgi:hypothetical protein
MRRPSPALIVAVIALIVALSGTAVAEPVITAAKKLVTSRDIRDGTIKTVDLSPKARRQLRGIEGAKGRQGEPGVAGAPGAAGPAGARGTDGANATLTPGSITPDLFSATAFPTARARSTEVQTLESTVPARVHLQADVHRRGVDHDTSSGDCGTPDTTPGDCFLTITRAGTYLITGSAAFSYANGGLRWIWLDLWTPGLASKRVLVNDGVNATEPDGTVNLEPQTFTSVSTVRQLTAGQAVSLTAYETSSGGLTVYGGTTNDAAAISVTWLGP